MIRPNHFLAWILGAGVMGVVLTSGSALAQADEDAAEAINNLFQGGSITLQDMMRAADYLDRSRSGPKDYGGSVDAAVEEFRQRQQQQLQIGPEIVGDEVESDLQQETRTEVERIDP